LVVATTAKGSVTVTTVIGKNSAHGKLKSNRKADLGSFLSEDAGEYYVTLDADMLAGRSGKAILDDAHEGGDDPDYLTTYDCARSK
jgi:hypothetical protein